MKAPLALKFTGSFGRWVVLKCVECVFKQFCHLASDCLETGGDWRRKENCHVHRQGGMRARQMRYWVSVTCVFVTSTRYRKNTLVKSLGNLFHGSRWVSCGYSFRVPRFPEFSHFHTGLRIWCSGGSSRSVVLDVAPKSRTKGAVSSWAFLNDLKLRISFWISSLCSLDAFRCV